MASMPEMSLLPERFRSTGQRKCAEGANFLLTTSSLFLSLISMSLSRPSNPGCLCDRLHLPVQERHKVRNFLRVDAMTDPVIGTFFELDTWTEPGTGFCDPIGGDDRITRIVPPKERLLRFGNLVILEQGLQFRGPSSIDRETRQTDNCRVCSRPHAHQGCCHGHTLREAKQRHTAIIRCYRLHPIIELLSRSNNVLAIGL